MSLPDHVLLGDGERRCFPPQGLEVWSLSAAVSHFLCCLLVPQFTAAPVGEDARKKSKRRGGRGAGAPETPNTSWSALTGPALWTLVCQDARETYDLTADHLGCVLVETAFVCCSVWSMWSMWSMWVCVWVGGLFVCLFPDKSLGLGEAAHLWCID